MRLIDADALLKDLSLAYDNNEDEDDPYNIGINAAIAYTKRMPTIEPKRGKWIWDDEGYHCSDCFYHAYGETGSILSNEWNYCPNCGARMERSEE